MNKTLLSIALLSLTAIVSFSKPRLVVVVTIDQLTSRNIEAHSPYFGTDAFRKLMQQCTVYTNLTYPHVPIDRSNAIATLMTGTSPYYHGIVGNRWLNRTTAQQMACTDDPQYNGVFTIDKASPRHMLTSTITDELKAATAGQALVYAIAERRDALKLAPHLDRWKRQEPQRLQDEVCHRIVRGTAAKPLHRLPVVATDEVLAPDAHLVYVAETRVGHLHLREEIVGREKPALENEQPVLRLLRGAAQDLRIVEREREGRLEESPEPPFERHERMVHMVDRARRYVDDVDVALVEHVGEPAEHLAVREVPCDYVAALLHEVAGGDDLEERGMRLEDRIVILEHRAAKPHEGDAHRRSVAVGFHFFTISVIADRNWATSLNWR